MNKISGILWLLVFVCVTVALLSEPFVSPVNVQNLVRTTALFGILGLGVAFVIITGGIDLSIGSLVGLTGCILPMLLIGQGWSPLMSLLAVMLIALLAGLAHGLLITKVPLQPFVVTLCGLLIYRGLARWITGDRPRGFGTEYDDSLRLLATGKPCTVAFVMLVTGVVLLLIAVGVWVRQHFTATGEANWRMTRLAAVATLGLLMIGIGGSRYSQGFEITKEEEHLRVAGMTFYSREVAVPDDAIGLPQKWMGYCGWLALPALCWFHFVGSRTAGWRLTIPLVAVVAAGGILGWATRDGPPPGEMLPRLQIAGLVALVMAALAWYARAGRRAGGEAAEAPFILATACGMLGLAGHTPLGRTLVPVPVFILAAIAALASLFLNQTVFGRYLFALGRNEEAARYSGIRTDRMVVLAYVICSGITGVGGILFALELNSVQPASHGNFFELYAIAAAVLGGCSLRGGEGTVLGVVIGAAVMRVLYNSIGLLGIAPQLEFTIIGTVILLGVVADEVVRRIQRRRQEKCG